MILSKMGGIMTRPVQTVDGTCFLSCEQFRLLWKIPSTTS